MWRTLFDLVFPKGCVGCGTKPAELPFCHVCWELVEGLPSWRCEICAGTVPPPLDFASMEEGATCGRCVASPPPFREVLAPFVYGGPVSQAVHRLKYRGAREIPGRLAGAMVEAGEEALATVDAIVPIPLHPSRRRERGFDQALLLARAVGALSLAPVERRLLSRTRESLHQVGKGREERGVNMQGAFTCGEGAEGLSLLLVDDVVTTGATASAAASALLDAGVREVRVLALARAL